jgi:hypothetical protein
VNDVDQRPVEVCKAKRSVRACTADETHRSREMVTSNGI